MRCASVRYETFTYKSPANRGIDLGGVPTAFRVGRHAPSFLLESMDFIGLP
jgi:hypothetical protein